VTGATFPPDGRRIPPRPTPTGEDVEARERILRTAYELFTHHGVISVGVDRIVADATVAKTTLYRHFRSKDELAVAVLERHEEIWTHGWLEREADRRSESPQQRLTTVFDLLEEWFRDEDYAGCLFTNTLLETHDRSSPVRAAAIAGFVGIYDVLRRFATEAGVSRPDLLAHRVQMVMRAMFVASLEGNSEATHEGRDLADLALGAAVATEGGD
jgi:AcrR family transcriptional regulator